MSEIRKSNMFPNYGTTKDGRVFRLSTGKEMKRYPSGRSKYLAFRACHKNKATTEFVHVAVADSWIPNPNNHSQVNHKDGNKINNDVTNLEWVSPAQNQWHAHETGLKSSGEDLYNSNCSNDQVHIICQLLEDGWTVKDISNRMEVNKDTVRKIRDGSCYFSIRVLYNIDHTYRADFSESTVRWVCNQILKGRSDTQVSKLSTNSSLKTIDVKRIRHKIRYRNISDEYF